MALETIIHFSFNVGRCAICGKPISPSELYAKMEDSDDLYCEECWKEYLDRCDALLEQMKKEKQQ